MTHEHTLLSVWNRYWKVPADLKPPTTQRLSDEDATFALLNWTLRFGIPYAYLRCRLQKNEPDGHRVAQALLWWDLPEITVDNARGYNLPRPLRSYGVAEDHLARWVKEFDLSRDRIRPESWGQQGPDIARRIVQLFHTAQVAPSYAAIALAWHIHGNLDGLDDLAHDMANTPKWVWDTASEEPGCFIPHSRRSVWERVTGEKWVIESIRRAVVGYGESFLEPFRRHTQARLARYAIKESPDPYRISE